MPPVRESRFQAELIKALRLTFPGCIILKNDANYLPGIPDLLILWHSKWAALEVKNAQGAIRSNNQRHYIKLMNKMSFAAFIHPDNRRQVIGDLQRAFGSEGPARISKPE